MGQNKGKTVTLQLDIIITSHIYSDFESTQCMHNIIKSIILLVQITNTESQDHQNKEEENEGTQESRIILPSTILPSGGA